MKMRTLQILFILIWMLFSCREKQYPYQEALQDYLKSTGIKLNTKQKVLIIPNQNCEACIREVLDLCLSGDCEGVDQVILTQNISENPIPKNIFIDTSNTFVYYETGVFEPFLIELDHNNWISWQKLKGIEKEEIRKILMD